MERPQSTNDAQPKNQQYKKRLADEQDFMKKKQQKIESPSEKSEGLD
jgi:hypothetical protein